VSVATGTIAGMRYGLDITSAGAWGRPDEIAELAALAEDHGWDGVFCEDYLSFPDGGQMYDVWVTLGLVAQATTRMMLGTMVTPLPCRHVPTVTLQAKTLAALSGGRFALGVGSGDPVGDPVVGVPGRSRGEVLDAALADIREAAPEVPIWVGGAATLSRPRARALRWDGSCLYRLPPPDWEDLSPDDVSALREEAGEGYVILVGGRERGEDLAADRRYVAAVADAGADWWQEYVPPRLTRAEARARIEAGPIVVA
jgi:alkanesulfonate monooxygenase SsuD/methylene tetrahydromethanopterin reductase-like flavin-dependent oxidoreductase (luciferase family)